VPTKSFKGTRLKPDKGANRSNNHPANGETTQRTWLWPAQGKVLRRFTSREESNGIEIGGKEGTLIRASANGKVVYAGSGLRGYGNLLILKHDNQFLSAYAHNRRLLVKENDTIAAGKEIAEMGKKNSGRPRLHFEIRKNGKPVDPLNYLPARAGD
jgi:lipoprotein NlpD